MEIQKHLYLFQNGGLRAPNNNFWQEILVWSTGSYDNILCQNWDIYWIMFYFICRELVSFYFIWLSCHFKSGNQVIRDNFTPSKICRFSITRVTASGLGELDITSSHLSHNASFFWNSQRHWSQVLSLTGNCNVLLFLNWLNFFGRGLILFH